MALALALLLAAAPVDGSSSPGSSTHGPSAAEATVRARGWSVLLAGGLTVVAGAGFFVGGRLLDVTGASAAQLNTATAFRIGGVLLASVGALVGLLSLTLFTFHDVHDVSVVLTATGGGVAFTW